jgi:hypothetical protein
MLANGKVYTHVIAKIFWLCDFPVDSIMFCYIEQQGLEELEDITAIGFDVAKDFFTVRDDGNFEAQPMLIHLRKFKVFLLYFMRTGQEFSITLNDDDVLDIKKTKFKKYCLSANYHADIATFGSPVISATSHARAIAVIDTTNFLTVQEIQ